MGSAEGRVSARARTRAPCTRADAWGWAEAARARARAVLRRAHVPPRRRTRCSRSRAVWHQGLREGVPRARGSAQQSAPRRASARAAHAAAAHLVDEPVLVLVVLHEQRLRARQPLVVQAHRLRRDNPSKSGARDGAPCALARRAHSGACARRAPPRASSATPSRRVRDAARCEGWCAGWLAGPAPRFARSKIGGPASQLPMLAPPRHRCGREALPARQPCAARARARQPALPSRRALFSSSPSLLLAPTDRSMMPPAGAGPARRAPTIIFRPRKQQPAALPPQ